MKNDYFVRCYLTKSCVYGVSFRQLVIGDDDRVSLILSFQTQIRSSSTGLSTNPFIKYPACRGIHFYPTEPVQPLDVYVLDKVHVLRSSSNSLLEWKQMPLAEDFSLKYFQDYYTDA